MSTYTLTSDNIYFLNDKNIVQTLHGSSRNGINEIPSLSLHLNSYKNLSVYTNEQIQSLSSTVSSINNHTYDNISALELSVNGISVYIDNLNLSVANMSSSINNLSSNLSSEILKLSTALSTNADALSANLSNEILKLSTAISTNVDTISANLSNEIEKLSNALSNDCHNLELSVNGLSNAVNAEFVHITGDTIAYLNVNNGLSVKLTAELNNNVVIQGSLIQGKNSKAIDNGGVVLGINAEAEHTNAFVWNGDNGVVYKSLNSHGTFNVNPEDGINGFYIGTTTLSDIIKNDVKVSYDALSSLISNTSIEISSNVDANRISDKKELSNVLSTYVNVKVDELCTTVDIRRTSDKEELSNALSSYSNLICSDLSISIRNAEFANYNTFSFTSLTNDHSINLTLNDNYGHSKTLSIDTTDFIKNRILDSAEITYDSEGKLVLRLYWEKDHSEGHYTDIQIDDLTKIYKAGDGIDISKDLTISANNTIARVSDLNELSANVKKLSTETIPVILDNVTNIQEYVDELSSTDADNPGIIRQLSNSIKLNALSIEALSNELNATSSIMSEDITKISNDVDIIKKFDDMLCTRVNDTDVGVIPTLSHDIDVLATEIRTATNYGGKITINKYHPDWVSTLGSNNLSTIFKYLNLAVDDKLKNGNLYEVEFSNDSEYDLSDTVFAADQSYTTDDKFTLHHKDWIYIATGDSSTYVMLTALNSENVHHILAVHYSDYYQLCNDVYLNYPWLSGGNIRDVDCEYYVEIVNKSPVIRTKHGHSFGANNDFEGDNRFYGRNYFLEQLTDFNSISCKGTISADGAISSGTAIFVANGNVSADANGISTLNNISAGVKLDVADNMNVDSKRLVVNNISVAGYLSVGNELSVATKVDFLTSNVTITTNGISSKYDLTVDNGISVGKTLSVANNLKVSETSVTIQLPTTLYSGLSVNGDTILSDKLTVEDATLLESTLTVDGNSTLSGTLAVKLSSRFDNTVLIKDDLSVDNVLSADVSEKKLTVNNLKVNENTTLNDLTAETISAGSLSIDWKHVINSSNGYTLYNLSTDLSNKIWIKDESSADEKIKNGSTSDLSIIKINKDEFDINVALKLDTLSSNVLYIVSADYIDAYGLQLCNLAMPDYSKLDVAVNRSYVIDVSANLSSEILKLSTALSTNVDTLSANLSSEILKLSTALSTNVDTLSANLSSEILKLSTALSTNVDTISANLSSEILKLSNALSTNVDTLSANLSSEILKLSSDLSIAISSKIFIKDIETEEFEDGKYSDLSVIKIKKDEFDSIIADETNTLNTLCSNVLYIVSADYMDAYGEVLSNLAMPDYSKLDVAVNRSYVIDVSANLGNEIEKLSNALSTNVDTLSANLSNEILKLSSDLSIAISSKIFIKDIETEEFEDGKYSDLSVIKIKKDEFDSIIADETNTLNTLCSNVLYIVSADYMDAYGEVLSNLTMTDDTTESEAASQHYVDNKDSALELSVNGISSCVNQLLTSFNTDTLEKDDVMKKLLADKNDSDISTVISAVMYIFNKLAAIK